jgi:hypothetical protein
MNSKRWVSLVGLLVVVALLAACGAASPAVSDRGTAQESYAGVPAKAPEPSLGTTDGNRTSSGAEPSLQELKVIQTANLTITVKETAAVLEFVQGLAAQMGGYIVASTSWQDNEQMRAQITLRVPAGQLQAALKQIRDKAVKVDKESVSSQDVTQEYTDNESRLRNLKAVEAELLELLTTAREKTGKAEDVLAIFRELTSVREQIEMTQGRQQYLDTMTAMSTITADIWPEPLEKPIVETGWKPLSTLRDALRTLAQTGQSIVDALIWLVVYVVPVLAVIAAPIVLIVWAARQARRKKAAKSQ